MTRPALEESAISARWPGDGLRSTVVRRPAHGLSGPSVSAGASSKGCCHEILVASALARISTTSGESFSGNCSISPNVFSRAHRSRPAWSGSGPVAVEAGSAGRLGGSTCGACHIADAAATRGCGVSSRARARAASACEPAPDIAIRSQAPSGEATWCLVPTARWNRSA
jgi:hypothetical protein